MPRPGACTSRRPKRPGWPHGQACEALQPSYDDGIQLFVDPVPALLIQDEAHLLDESLGTFAGLFESTLDAIFAYLFTARKICRHTTDGKRRRAKVIAASATVADPERQLEHLYQRHIPATQFPHPGPDLYHSFYAAPASRRSRAPRVARYRTGKQDWRFYAGFMTNGRPHTATSVAILATFHVVVTELLGSWCLGKQLDYKARRPCCATSALGTQAVSASGTRACYGRKLATLIDLHRIALTYVTNKKGGDQIMAAEAEETRKRHVAPTYRSITWARGSSPGRSIRARSRTWSIPRNGGPSRARRSPLGTRCAPSSPPRRSRTAWTSRS